MTSVSANMFSLTPVQETITRWNVGLKNMPNHFARIRQRRLAVSIAHWYDARLVSQGPPVRSRGKSLNFKIVLLLINDQFFLLGPNFDWVALLKLAKR